MEFIVYIDELICLSELIRVCHEQLSLLFMGCAGALTQSYTLTLLLTTIKAPTRGRDTGGPGCAYFKRTGRRSRCGKKEYCLKG